MAMTTTMVFDLRFALEEIAVGAFEESRDRIRIRYTHSSPKTTREAVECFCQTLLCAGDGSFAGGEAIAGVVMQNHSRRKAQLGVETGSKEGTESFKLPCLDT